MVPPLSPSGGSAMHRGNRYGTAASIGRERALLRLIRSVTAERTVLRRTGALALALFWLGAPCGAQGRVAQSRIASAPRAQMVRIGRITLELPPGFVADSTANMMDGFH